MFDGIDLFDEWLPPARKTRSALLDFAVIAAVFIFNLVGLAALSFIIHWAMR